MNIHKVLLIASCSLLFAFTCRDKKRLEPDDGIKVIYLVNNLTGNLGGVVGADALCDAEKPLNVAVAKAMLVDGTNRVACTTSLCTGGITENVDWVLTPNTTYYRDGTNEEIGTTDSSGIFITDLTNTIFSGGATEAWTGLQDDWTEVGDHCLDWTSDSGSNTASVGVSDNVTRSIPLSYIFAYLQFCDRTNVSIYCVEQ